MAKYPKASLRVYAVWYNMMEGDARSRWPARMLTDPRVAHLWDEGYVVGKFYTQIKPTIMDKLTPDSNDFRGPIMWDAWYLYPPTSRWDTAPTGLAAWGRTILMSSQSLVRELNARFAPK